jgi:aryl-alcohol dehydrogenase-like predicted oxidoreductase
MADSVSGGTLTLAGDLTLSRMGYGAMQLAGPGVFGPPRDRDQALNVLREAVELGLTHIDTSDFYGPVVVNELIREALHPYPASLRIVTKVGARQAIAPVVTVQNLYNVAARQDDALVDRCAAEGIAYAPFFPLGGFTPLQSQVLADVAARLGASAHQVALAWLLQRSPTIVLIPGTSSVAHLRENVAAADLVLPADAVADLDTIGG